MDIVMSGVNHLYVHTLSCLIPIFINQAGVDPAHLQVVDASATANFPDHIGGAC